MLAWAFTVWRWEDPFTALLNRFDQRELSQNFERRFDSFEPAAEPTASEPTAAPRRSVRPSLPRSAAKWRAKRPNAAMRSRGCASRGSA